MNIFDPLVNRVKGLAYGSAPVRKPTPIESGQFYRLERGQPYYRLGKPVYAVPQFRAVNLFSPTIQNALLPTISVTPTRIAYPVKVK
jgi:hypothetical protein